MIENVIAIIAATGGIILMIGSLVLLYQGRITLQAIHDKVQEGKDPAEGTGGDALAVEIWPDQDQEPISDDCALSSGNRLFLASPPVRKRSEEDGEWHFD